MVPTSTDLPAWDSFWRLRRWHEWLTEQLSPARIVLTECGVFNAHEYRWQVDFPSGETSIIRIPDSLIEAGPEEFESVTDRLEAYGWIKALKLAGPKGLWITSRGAGSGG